MKTLKRTIFCVCLLALCLSILPIQGRAEHGMYAQRISWLFEDGILTISGTGDLPAAAIPWTSFQDSISEIVITSGITSLDNALFQNCTTVTSVILPDTLTHIGRSAFAGCNSLESVICNATSLQKIEASAFDGCDALDAVYISDLLGWCAIDFSASKTSNPLSKGADLYLNDQLVTNLVIPGDYQVVSLRAFYGCTSLRTVTISDGITKIHGFAFADCPNLTTVTIPGSVQRIDSGVFDNCENLEMILYDGTIKQFKNLRIYDVLDNDYLNNNPWNLRGPMQESQLYSAIFTVTLRLGVLTACIVLLCKKKRV